MNQTKATRMTRRVLLIDDDDLVRKTLRRALEGADFEVVEAADGDQGIRSYKAEPFGVVVTDILMPGKEGIETIIELRRMNPEVRIVAISGGDRVGGQQYLNMAAKLGADRILPKPFRPKELLDAVRDVLSGE